MKDLTKALRKNRRLDDEGLKTLLESKDAALVEALHHNAREVTDEVFGRQVWLRALIEWSNVCRNDCLYCGIRRSNGTLPRYSLSRDEILACCDTAWREGIRTFVLQGGENPQAAASLVETVAAIRAAWPHAAITLSLGELPAETYARLRQAGADRYLLRHEAADPQLYAQLHPAEMNWKHRIDCLHELRRLGFQTGMGMMVGAPFQTTDHLIRDIRLIESFRPEMIGIGPFVPQRDTPLGHFPAGSPDLTLRLYSILRLMHPHALIPSTTALSTLLHGNRLAGLHAGANVIMPDFTPARERSAYALYDGKNADWMETTGTFSLLRRELAEAGYSINPGRGDYSETVFHLC